MKNIPLFVISFKILYLVNTCLNMTNMCKKGSILSNYSCVGDCNRYKVESLGESQNKDFVCEVRKF